MAENTVHCTCLDPWGFPGLCINIAQVYFEEYTIVSPAYIFGYFPPSLGPIIIQFNWPPFDTTCSWGRGGACQRCFFRRMTCFTSPGRTTRKVSGRTSSAREFGRPIGEIVPPRRPFALAKYDIAWYNRRNQSWQSSAFHLGNPSPTSPLLLTPQLR